MTWPIMDDRGAAHLKMQLALSAISDPALGHSGMKAPRFWFDAVVMLTWSNWHTEPRSNRYHYASRFARHLPVYFVQADGSPGAVSFEPIEGTNITIVHVPQAYDAAQATLLDKALKQRGVFRQLQWIYNVYFEHYIAQSNPRIRVYHATEDYVTPTEGLRAAGAELIDPIKRVLPQADLLIAVTEGVEQAYRVHAGYSGRSIVLRNGCDAAFWEASGATAYQAPPQGLKVALYQGGINRRLDFDLLGEIALLLPDWEFWFCGDTTDGGKGWRNLAAKSNVRWHGRVGVEEIARLARQSTIGLIPFKQDPLIDRSLPLKAFEYVACGLPVVSVPILALRDQSDVFAFETTAAGFAAAMTRLAPSRVDAASLRNRQKAAAAESYDTRFEGALAAIDQVMERKPSSTASLNVLMLYDEGSAIVRTIYEHLEAFSKYSRHRYHMMSATRYPAGDASPRHYDFSSFDAVVIHYSVRVSVPQHLTDDVAEAITRYRGPKILFIQDEYENTETARQWIERLGIDSVFTNVPEDHVRAVYNRKRFPDVDFVQTLTGYVPDDPDIDDFALPMDQRPIVLGYRGRELPHHYGDLGHDKWRIGHDVRGFCERRGISHDIAVDQASRLSGTDWYRFLGSCRAMLGTESGSNIFDDDGSLKILAERHRALPFAEFKRRFLSDAGSQIPMNQVSPKIFEAIRLRTAMVLFEGAYSGVIEPEVHYIPLKHDYSNIDAVFEKLSDIELLRSITARAYSDVIHSGRYSYRTFIDACDRYLDLRIGKRPRARIVSVPAVAVDEAGTLQTWPVSKDDLSVVTNLVADGRSFLDKIAVLTPSAISLTEEVRLATMDAPRASPQSLPIAVPKVSVLRRLWRMLPERVRAFAVRILRRRIAAVSAQAPNSLQRRLGRSLMRWLPPAIQRRLRSWL